MSEPVTIVEDLLAEAKPCLERALVASFGVQAGLDAAAAALAAGWERSDRLIEMANPVGYLFTIGRNHARRAYRCMVELPPVPSWDMPEVEPGLPRALKGLTEQQRSAVILVHGFGYNYREASQILDISVSTLRNHLARGLEKLRSELGVQL